ncbi:hypothetical protein QBC45DRAFT_126878 [Copromyces sp. CBS 386.78]|nr:hypothetical protein QBC45DRAFT_126878 [Copromyces sp. CBS 386.78]
MRHVRSRDLIPKEPLHGLPAPAQTIASHRGSNCKPVRRILPSVWRSTMSGHGGSVARPVYEHPQPTSRSSAHAPPFFSIWPRQSERGSQLDKWTPTTAGFLGDWSWRREFAFLLVGQLFFFLVYLDGHGSGIGWKRQELAMEMEMMMGTTYKGMEEDGDDGGCEASRCKRISTNLDNLCEENLHVPVGSSGRPVGGAGGWKWKAEWAPGENSFRPYWNLQGAGPVCSSTLRILFSLPGYRLLRNRVLGLYRKSILFYRGMNYSSE